LRTGAIAALTLSTAFGHYTWVEPSAPLVAGKPVKIMVAHGDRFPHGDEAINAAQVKLAVLAPSGARAELKAAVAGNTVLADFTPRESGAHRIVFTQDRGVMSRTPKGVKSGGRDKNPGATEAFALVRTGVSYVGGAGGATPSGLDLEITAQYAGGVWQLQLWRGGSPLAGETIQVLRKEHEDGSAIGKTGADGKLVYKPADATGPALFLAEVKEKAAVGGPVDYRTFSTSTYVTW
jgi:uncharacterized GH25 family protein